MHTTGSRTTFRIRPVVAKLLLGTIVAAISLGALGVFAIQRTGAVVGSQKITVNSVLNTEDGLCEGEGNTAPVTGDGDCTLREAITAVNNGLATTINFRLATFPKASPGVINIEGGAGALPTIVRDIIIDATTAGVILDCDKPNDGVSPCLFGLHAEAATNGFSFTLLGRKNFVIRQIGGDGIAIHGLTRSLGVIDIEGVTIFQVTGDGIVMNDNVTNFNNVDLINNDINAEGGDDAIDMETNNTKLTKNDVLISNNRLIGQDHGVRVSMRGDLNGKLLVDISGNREITGLGDEGVRLLYCRFLTCNAHDSAINFRVNNNAKIHGEDSGIRAIIRATGQSPTAGPVHADIQTNGNGRIDSNDDEAINSEVETCCNRGGGTNNTSSIKANGNADLVGSDQAVEIEVDLGCGDDNISNVQVNDNARINSEGDEDNHDGVQAHVHVGDFAGGCPGSGGAGAPGAAGALPSSDHNTSTIEVNHNAEIDGGAFNGVFALTEVGSSDGRGDKNTSTVDVSRNGLITGQINGVDVSQVTGTESGSDGDNNLSTATVTNNSDINGGKIGVHIDINAGAEDGVVSVVDCGGPPCGDTSDGDDNATSATVTGNLNVTGNDGSGVFVGSKAGGGSSSSIRNANTAVISGNGNLKGRHSSGGDGVTAELLVCCDSANTNTLTIGQNREITGRNANGIAIELCCSTNTVGILNNALIRGDGGNGIDYFVLAITDGDADFTEPCPVDCGVFSSVNMLTIRDNLLDNSESDGIEICCGAFQYPTATGAALKSVIRDNVITHNRDHGIELHNSSGLNIGPANQISLNGNDPLLDRGIEIDISSMPGVKGNRNTITRNSIYDNIGLGIDLIGDTNLNGTYEDADHAIGCVSYSAFPSPNDCIPFPTILTQSGNKLVGTACSLCTVEIFIADETPADQPILGIQQGEGKTFLVSSAADALGNFSITLPCGQAQQKLTATATDKIKNTSEFSVNFLTLGTSSCATATPTITNTGTPTNTFTPAPPTATFTPALPTATVAAAKACGDVNDSGSVNSVDAQLVLQLKAALIPSLINPASADVNGDGNITAVDAALILQLEAGLINALTGC